MLPAICQVYVSSPEPLQRQKLPDVDGVAAKLETFGHRQYGCPEKAKIDSSN